MPFIEMKYMRLMLLVHQREYRLVKEGEYTDTFEAILSGVLSCPLPKTKHPKDIKWYQPFEGELKESEVRKALREGRGATCSCYYGTPYVWYQDGKYYGELLQYREVTDEFVTDSLDEAVKRFMEWYQQVC